MRMRICTAVWAMATMLGLAAAAAHAAPSDYSVAARIAGPDGGWDLVSFDPNKARVYVSRTDGVTVLDANTGALTGHLADGQRTHAVVPLDRGTKLLVTNGGTDSVHLVDADSGRLLADIPTVPKPDGAIFHPASGLVLVMSHSGQVGLIDPVAQKSVGTIDVGGALELAAADGDKVFVNVEDKAEIAVISVGARQVVARYPLKGCEGPTGLALARPAGVLISSCANGLAKVIRASDGADLGDIAIGKGPDTVMYDETRRLVLIPCGRDGVLEVITATDAAHVALVQTLKTELGARTGAVDPKTGRIYLPTAKYDLTQASAGRFPTVPGSFVILVAAPN
jgi:hypothetical protein